MQPRTHTCLSALVLLGILHSNTPALAQDKHDVGTAELLFDEGLRLMSQESYEQACEKFAASHELDPSVGALLNEAKCREQLGQTASAWILYREARTRARKLGDRKRLRVARRRSRALEKQLSYLTIEVPDDSLVEGLAIVRNGQPVVDAAWNQRVPMDPGHYEIGAEAPGRESWSTVVEVGAGSKHEIVEIPLLAVRVPEPVAPRAAPVNAMNDAAATDKKPAKERPQHRPQHRKHPRKAKSRPETIDRPILAPTTQERVSTSWSWQKKAALGIGVAGVASLVAGGVFGMQARSRWNEALTHCGPDRTQCDAQGVALGDEAGKLSSRANITIAAGAVAVGAGAVLWMVSRGKRRAENNDRTAVIPLVTPHSAGARVTVEF